MPGRVGVVYRIIIAVAVPVETLRASGIWNYGICLGKPSQLCVVVASPVVIQPCLVELFAGELMLGVVGACLPGNRAVGREFGEPYLAACTVRNDVA